MINSNDRGGRRVRSDPRGVGDADHKIISAGDDADRWARVALAAASDPGDRMLFDAVARLGAVEVLASLRDRGPMIDELATRDRLRDRLAAVRVDRMRTATDSARARVLVPGDDEWPVDVDLLAELATPSSAPPLALWARGPLRVDDLPVRRAVALVGSRAATTYGAETATSLAYDLATRGVVVVSGAAYGIDAAAHRGALVAEGGVTVAVLANGIDRVYPSGHDALVGRIAADGLVLTEAAPGQYPTKMRFLTRNRLIAALSQGVVVVEAALRSGALNTAHWAVQLSRQLMAVPGPVTSKTSEGAHRAVIDRGAALVTDAADVLELISPPGTDLQLVRRGEERPTDRLAPDALAVLEAMPTRASRDTGELAVLAGVAIDVAVGALGELAADGWVERTDRGWRRLG